MIPEVCPTHIYRWNLLPSGWASISPTVFNYQKRRNLSKLDAEYESAMRDHLGGNKSLCPTIYRNLSITICTKRKHFSPILCHRKGEQLCMFIFSCKKFTCDVMCSQFLSYLHSPVVMSGHYNSYGTDSSAPGMCSLYDVEFLGSVLLVTSCRSHNQRILLSNELALQN